MVRLGYVYGNLMVNLHQKNSKLAARAASIVEQALGIDQDHARILLRRAANKVPVAIVMAIAGVSKAKAEAALADSRGHVRKAITIASSKAKHRGDLAAQR
jgi:N-acetylmuramic acid 6-phosphate etherase